MVVDARPAAPPALVFDVSAYDRADARRLEEEHESAYPLAFLLQGVEGGKQKSPFRGKIGHGRSSLNKAILPKKPESSRFRLLFS